MNNRHFFWIIPLWIIAGTLAIIASTLTYGQMELRAFNKLNNTHYTMTQWRIYEYEIKKLYPFKGQE